MKNELPCAVVHDLLPSYIEGLTEPETTALVREHLHTCPACRARWQALSGEETTPDTDEIKQVDYLKKVRRKNGQRVLLGMAAACLAVVLLIGCGLFLVGTRVKPDQILYEAQLAEDGSALEVQLRTTSSALSLVHERVHLQGDTASVQVRQVLVSPLHTSDTVTLYVPVTDVDTVQLLGQPIWQEGTCITQWATALWETRTPYVGSMSSVAKVARLIPLAPIGYTNELHTDAAPYGWSLHFEEPLSAAQQEQVQRALPLALVLVDNLDEIFWTWPGMTEAEQAAAHLTTAGCTAQLPAQVDAWNQAHTEQLTAPASIKDYAESPRTLQQLMDLWNIR